jgi:hypothetical protein
MKCGAQNDDKASFCVACGANFREVGAAISTASASSQPATKTFHAEMTAGEHKHILTDIVFKDNGGVVVFTAKRPSLLHESFEVFDAGGQMLGHVNRKIHLMGSSFETSDASQRVISVVQIRNSRQRGRLPTCWLEDGAGDKQATVEFQGFLNFDLVKLDGSKVLSAGIASEGGGVRQELRDMMTKRFLIQVFDQTFSGLQLAGTFTALDTALAG